MSLRRPCECKESLRQEDVSEPPGFGETPRFVHNAKLQVAWVFGQDPCWIPIPYNNPHLVYCKNLAANEFVTTLCGDFKLDVLHHSPPCQIFSVVYTIPGASRGRGMANLAIGDGGGVKVSAWRYTKVQSGGNLLKKRGIGSGPLTGEFKAGVEASKNDSCASFARGMELASTG